MKLIFNLDKRKHDIVFYDIQDPEIVEEGVVCIKLEEGDYSTLVDLFHSLNLNENKIGCVYDSKFCDILGFDMERVSESLLYIYLTIREIEPFKRGSSSRNPLTGHLFSPDGTFEAVVRYAPSKYDEGYYILQEVRDYGDWIYDKITRAYYNTHWSKRDLTDLDRLSF